ncbi:hypothetical protein LZ198_16380 [Myxococcus sp. K15C18031901]|uniref:hypothetical protein n=1 Tax=Myxococcus dinghuensis TaxID=2906761 RepID=UPI0020A7BB4E|nr:hypothetical protein [Myxococcus dinghuensis]MCP3100447.1 hypothetical protein [Myxococcus dinghuensis]
MSRQGLEHSTSILTAALVSALLAPTQAMGGGHAPEKKPVVCGGSRDLYLGTYKGRVFKEWQTPLTDEQLQDPMTRMANDALVRNNYTLTLRFHRDAQWNYWVDTTVQFDNLATGTPGPGHRDNSDYALDLSGQAAKVQFAVTRRPSAPSLTKPPATLEKASRTQPTGFVSTFRDKFLLEALDCDEKGIPHRLLFTRLVGGQQPIFETRELFRLK